MAFDKAVDSAVIRNGKNPRSKARIWDSVLFSNNVKYLALFAIVICIFINILIQVKPATTVKNYQDILVAGGFAYLVAIVFAYKSKSVNMRLNYYAPLFASALLIVGLWDLLTTKTHVISTQYVLTPEQIINSAFASWKTILLGTLYSLELLGLGFVIGALGGVITGVAIGWSQKAHYWIKPLVNVIGPIPVVAYTPIAIVAFPTTFWAGVWLIAITTWFPITVMTNSGISNVLNTYYEVAKTLGADVKYLIFKVAIPVALPSIFTGFFLGLLSAFITLSVAETIGIRQGLGWYVGHGMSGAYVMVIILFSGLVTLLFKIRDRVLFWQKGLIRW